MRQLPLILILALVTLTLDQITKALITTHLQPDQFVYPIRALSDVSAIHYVTNTGIAFGLLENANTLMVIVSIAIILILLGYARGLPADRRLAQLALGLAIGGAAGNLVDRLRLGHVIDFIAVGSFARFNVADSGIFVGLALLAIGSLFERPQPKPE